MKIRAKRKKNWQNHWEWLNKPFRNTSKPWEWFRNKGIGFRTSWRQEMLNGVSVFVNSCFKDRIGRGFYIALWPATKNGSTTIIPSAENLGECPDIPPRSCSAFGETSSVWYYELLKSSETITGDQYWMQLMGLSRALKEKRPQYQERHDKVILQHDNARPHIARPVKTYLETLKWEVLPHRRTLQTLLLPTTICFDRWHTAWMISISAFMKK